jgi:hypothetical protein
MKKMIYSLALLSIAATSASAQESLWRDGTFNGGSGTYSAGQLGTMDYWPETPNGQALGWYGAVSGSTGSSILVEEAEGRNFASNSLDKAAKITVDWKGNATYHIIFRTLSYVGEKAKSDYNPFELESNTPFYYSFWAKTDNVGYAANKLLPTINENVMGYTAKNITHSTNGNTTLTTEWQQYVFEVTGSYTINSGKTPAILFTFQAAGVVYIDDVEIYTGAPTGINGMAAGKLPVTVIASESGITFSSSGGKVSVYDSTGSLAAQKNVGEGIEHIALPGKGLYIVKLSKDNKNTIAKAIVK